MADILREVSRGAVLRKPGQWRDSYAGKDTYGQKMSRQAKVDAKRSKQEFQPFCAQHSDKLLDSDAITNELNNMFLEKAGGSVFVLTRQSEEETSATTAKTTCDARTCSEHC